MNETSTIPFSDLVFVSPKATTSAAAAVPPVAAAPLSNSGDGLGIHEPRSMTWGGDIVATAPSGRADISAKCPAVTGSLSEPAPILSSRAPNLAELASAGSALSSRVSIKNVTTFAVAAASEIISKSTSLVEA